MTVDRPDVPQTLREEAAGWFAKMRGEDADAHRAEFERWLSRGALHRAAYNRVGEIFAAGKILKRAVAADQRRSGRSGRGLVALGLALIAASGLLAAHLTGNALFEKREPPARASVQVARSTRTLELGAGARALLDIDGRVSLGAGGRVGPTRLDQGRARFTVPSDGGDHVFLAGGVELRSRGGSFDLWLRRDGSLDTKVLTGAVRLAPAVLTRAAGALPHFLIVSAGDACRSEPSGRTGSVRAASGTEWPEGILEFRGATLAEVLEEANRYSAMKIRVADASLAARRLTGRIAIADAHRLARQIAAALSIDSDESRPGTILLRTRR